MSGFNIPPTTSAPSFSVGAAPISFGSSSTPQVGFSFGTPTATTTPNLGLGSTQTTSAFGSSGIPSTGSFNFSGQTTTATPFTSFPKTTQQQSFSLGTNTTTSSFNPSTSAPGISLNPATTNTGLALGNLTAKTTVTTFPGFNLVSTTSSKIGLGGVDINATQPKSNEGKNDNLKIKETQVPEQISKTVEDLKIYMKQQKVSGSDISRTSTSKLTSVSKGIQNLNWSLQEIRNLIEQNFSQVKILRSETTKTIQHTEMAQRTQETPAGLQYENTAPLQYVQELVQKYESDLIKFKNQVEITEKQMKSLSSATHSFSVDDLKQGLKYFHESFIALAGRLHELHQQVEEQKEYYLNLRKYFIGNKVDVFAEVDSEIVKKNTSQVTSGPSPFSIMPGFNRNTTAGAINQGQLWSGSIQNHPSSSVGQSVLQGSFMGQNSSLNLSSSAKDSFNLQKPPIGAKRNKS